MSIMKRNKLGKKITRKCNVGDKTRAERDEIKERPDLHWNKEMGAIGVRYPIN